MSGPEHDRHGDPEHDDAEARRLAVRAAGGSEGPRAVGAALGDADWRVRKEAALAAGRLAGDPAVIAILVDALLQPDDVGLRNAAIEAFAHVGARGAAPLLDALERSPTTARKFVCAALGGTGPEGVPALARLARDPDPNTATVAVESLARIGGPDAEAALRERLAAEDWVVRLAALEGLAGLGARVPAATLAPMVDDALLRRFAIRLLGKSSDPTGAPALLRALATPTSDAEIAAIVIAVAELAEHVSVSPREIGAAVRELPEGSIASVRALVTDDDVIAARAAAQVLAAARDIASLAAIAGLAARAELGPGALEAFRAFGHDAVRPLLSIAPGLDPMARAWALEAAAELAALPDRAAMVDPVSGADPMREVSREDLAREVRAALTHALEAREDVVVHAATRGLSHWAEPADAELLVRVGSMRSGAIARAAGSALEALSHAAPQSVELALEDAPPDGAEAWSAAIAAMPEEAALAKLREAISSGEASARRAALLALDRIDGSESAELAAMALADEDVDVRIAAVTALSRMRSEGARAIASSTLRVAIREASPAVRAAAARGLGALGEPDAGDALRELLRDPGPGVALAALSALRMITQKRGDALSRGASGGPRVAGGPLASAGGATETDLEELLVDVLGHPDDEVVKEGLRAVAEGGLDRKETRLALGLAHHAWDVRRLAASLLGAIDSDEARASLRERAAIETDDLVRAAIASALGTGAGA